MTISSDNSNVTLKNTAIGTAAVVAGWEGQTYISKAAKYPFAKYLGSKIPSISGGGFLPYVNTALRQNNLEGQLRIVQYKQLWWRRQIWLDERRRVIQKPHQHMASLAIP